MGIINKLPWGLQDFLGSVSQGTNPANLLQDVRPSLEIFPFLSGNDLRVYDVAEQAVNSAGDIHTKAVNTGEIWLVLNVGAGVRSDTAGDTLEASVGLKRVKGHTNTNFEAGLHGFPAWTAIGGTLQFNQAVNFPQMIPVTAGVGIVWKATNVVSVGDLLLQPSVLYYRLRV